MAQALVDVADFGGRPATGEADGRAERPSRPSRPSRGALSPVATSEELVAQALTGDREAFRSLFQRHRVDVARLVRRMAGPGADPDDLLQEVFLQVHRSLKDFRREARFSTWLHRVTVNVVLMHRRAARSRPVLSEALPDDRLASRAAQPDEDAERRERARAFARVVERIGEKKRVVFILHDLEGVAPTEIAEIVGAPVLTVRTRLFYARRELAAMLADEPALAAIASEPRPRGSAKDREG